MWCKALEVKFNQEKTEIIPIGSEEHRRQVVTSHKLNKAEHTPMDRAIC